jgi:hypothetical protein
MLLQSDEIVELAPGRFVGQHHKRVADQSAGDRHPLSLAA